MSLAAHFLDEVVNRPTLGFVEDAERRGANWKMAGRWGGL